jgi:hypothetical protein
MHRFVLVSFVSLWSLFNSKAQAFQVQVRAFHTQSQLSHTGGSSSATWNGSYLQGPSQTLQETPGPAEQQYTSLGQELSVGFELWYPHLFLSLALAQAIYHPRPDERIEDRAPKLSFAWITNVQDRWMPFVSLGVAQHQLTLMSDRIENRALPATLGLDRSADTFGVRREWEDLRLWNGEASLGCKFYTFPTTAIVLEYRYTDSLVGSKLREKEQGVSSYREGFAFIEETTLSGVRLRSQELSVALESDF